MEFKLNNATKKAASIFFIRSTRQIKNPETASFFFINNGLSLLIIARYFPPIETDMVASASLAFSAAVFGNT